jgi:hypothetical protein
MGNRIFDVGSMPYFLVTYVTYVMYMGGIERGAIGGIGGCRDNRRNLLGNLDNIWYICHCYQRVRADFLLLWGWVALGSIWAFVVVFCYFLREAGEGKVCAIFCRKRVRLWESIGIEAEA